MKHTLSSRRGQNTVEYLMMVSVVVGVVLVSGAMLKQFMPSLFGSVEQMIAGTAGGSDDSGSGGGSGNNNSGGGLGTGTASSSSGSNSKTISNASSSGSGLSGGVAAAGSPYASASAAPGADGGTRAEDGSGHPPAKGIPPPHTP
jgi:hypothetical protein